MQTAYFWHQFPLSGYKIASIVVLMLVSFEGMGQSFRKERKRNPDYDQRKVSYGFMIGLHTSAYQIEYSDRFVTPRFDTIHSVMTPPSFGFSLGFLANLKLNSVLDLRIMPKAGFYNHALEYHYTSRRKETKLVQTTMVEFPLLLKYQSRRRGNARMYVVGGFTPAVEASGQNDEENNSFELGIRAANLTLDAGIGFDIYFPLFKLSQEIRFSMGVLDILNPDVRSVYGNSLKRINTHTVSIYFIFQ